MKLKAWVMALLGLLAGLTLMCTQVEKPAGTSGTPAPAPTAGASSEPVHEALIPVAHRPADNGFCLVCHKDLRDELISRAHETKNILCVDCHGASSLHMEDEMLMTPPDVLYGRAEVAPFCRQCHKAHKEPDEVEAFRRKWLGKDRPNGRVISSASTCTDCHGTHNIRKEEPAKTGHATTGGSPWIPLFNGKDLAGWESVGGAKWAVENGLLVGTQGENFAPGDLLTKKTYRDFLLTVTYRVEWPCNSGVWFRYQSAKKAYQADVLEYKDPECYSGTVYCPGKMFIAMNKDKTLVDREGWNTMSVRCEGDHLQVWLNGRQVADVHDDTSESGKIGFQVHPGESFGKMKIIVREALIQPLTSEK